MTTFSKDSIATLHLIDDLLGLFDDTEVIEQSFHEKSFNFICTKEPSPDNLQISNILGDNPDPNHSIFTQFDMSFSFANTFQSVIDDSNKQAAIFHILQYSHKYNQIPSTRYLQMRLLNENIMELKSECNNNVTECSHFLRLQSVMSQYTAFASNSQNKTQAKHLDIFNTYLSVILDDYLHLLSEHCEDDMFEVITMNLEQCDINQCEIFGRNYRVRHKCNESKLYGNQYYVVCMQMLDKIHCYYSHTYDTGYKLTSKDRAKLTECKDDDNVFKGLIDQKTLKTKQMLYNNRKKLNNSVILNSRANIRYKFQSEDKKDNDDGFKEYHNGHAFQYGFKGEMHCVPGTGPHTGRNDDKPVQVLAKYTSLKEELTTNVISALTMEQFNNEYRKAHLNFSSVYCKKTVTNRHHTASSYDCGLLLENILSVEIYCNYDVLSCEFSKTYRENEGENHDNFYWMGKWLKILVHEFGIKGYQCADAFYHGIDDMFKFKRM
eukprot:274225_1